MTLQNIEETGNEPPRLVVYGPPKIGKSTMAAQFDRPIFQRTEDGLTALKVKAFPKAESLSEVMTNLQALAEEEHDYKTYVLDSADHLEPLIWQQVCEESNAERIELADGGYGKGYIAALNLWREFFSALDYLRSAKGMTIIIICHAQVKRFESPTTDAYDRYEPKLHKLASAFVMESADAILFVDYVTGIRKEADSSKQKDEDKRKRGVGSGDRMIYTEARPAFMAGNRYSFPAEIPFDKAGQYVLTIANGIDFFNAGGDESAGDDNGEQAALPAPEKEDDTKQDDNPAKEKKGSKKK